MKKISILLLLAAILGFFSGCGKKQDDASVNKSYLSNRERMESYVYGYDLAGMIKSAGDFRKEFSGDAFWSGFTKTINFEDIGTDVDQVMTVFEDQDSLVSRMERTSIKGVTDNIAKQSYIIGVYHANGIAAYPETFHMQSFKAGFDNEISFSPSVLSEEEMNAVRSNSLKLIERLHRNADISVSKEEKSEINREFLVENAKREKVKTLHSGLQYVVLKEGSGKKIKGSENVQVHYRAYFIDGREFDSSYKKDTPAQFSLTDDILPGWKEGIKLMRAGARYKFFLPPELAYGEEGFNEIPPNSVLIFDIELLNVSE